MQEITSSWLLLVPLGVALTWAASRWWHDRQRRRVEHRLTRMQADRDALLEQAKRARQQVAQLQKDLSALRQAAAASVAARTGNTRSSETPASVPPVVKLRPELPKGLVFEAPPLAAHGFADTQPFDSDAHASVARKRS